ncbi:MAG: MFS transporter, partial [Patescibacteria group bacterium]
IGNIGGPSWFALMGEIVPEKERGSYFSKRNKIIGIIALVVTLLAAFFLDYMKSINYVLIGFAIIFATASLGRYVSAFLLTKHYYPKDKMKKESYFGFFQFLKKSPNNNFGKFVIYVGLINLATNFAAPFFAVYMLKELNYSYVWFTIVTLSGALFTIWSMPLWGKIGDQFGNKKLLTIGSVMVPFAALFWLFSKNPIIIIFTSQLVAGIGWAAFNLAVGNFIYD